MFRVHLHDRDHMKTLLCSSPHDSQVSANHPSARRVSPFSAITVELRRKPSSGGFSGLACGTMLENNLYVKKFLFAPCYSNVYSSS